MTSTGIHSGIRVAFLVHTFHMGGLERCVAHLLNGLDRDKISPSLICLNRNGSAAQWLTRSDFPIVEMKKTDGHDWRLPGRLASVFRDLDLNIVHSHNWGTLLETALARRKAKGIRHVHAERGTVFGGSQPGVIKGWVNRHVFRWALSSCDAVLAVAEDVAQRVVSASGFAASRIQVIPNGVAVPPCPDRAQARRSIRAELGIEEQAIVFGSVGRLVEVKCYDLAIRAVQNLPVDAHLLLVGEGPEQDRLQALARELGLDRRVHFAGRQSGIGPWMAAMDVYINCSRSEGMSQSILEAMGFGLPEVVTDVGDSRRLVGGDDGCGVIVPPNDVNQLTQALSIVASDPGLRNDLAQKGPLRHAQSFALSTMIRKYESIYERLVEPPGSKVPTSHAAAMNETLAIRAPGGRIEVKTP